MYSMYQLSSKLFWLIADRALNSKKTGALKPNRQTSIEGHTGIRNKAHIALVYSAHWFLYTRHPCTPITIIREGRNELVGVFKNKINPFFSDQQVVANQQVRLREPGEREHLGRDQTIFFDRGRRSFYLSRSRFVIRREREESVVSYLDRLVLKR